MKFFKKYSNYLLMSTLFAFTLFAAGCGTGEDPILGDAYTSTGVVPKVVAVAPANNETNVSRNIRYITAEFSRAMESVTLTPSSFTLSKGSVLETGGSVAYANKVAELDLNTTQVLDSTTTYTATITTDASSTDGTPLANNYVWTFTTGLDSDNIKPTVISTSPRDGDLNVSIKKLITATFSEAMFPSSITKTTPAATFSVMETNSFIDVNGIVAYSVINKIASFKPASDLALDTNYTAKITTIAEDLAGNAMASDYNWTFVTAANAPAELVDFGLAAPYGIASTKGVTNTPTLPNTQIDGYVVLNPNDTCNGVAVSSGTGGTFGLCDGAAPILTAGHEVITLTYPDTTTAQPITDDFRAAYLSITPANMPGGTPIAAGTTLGAPVGNAPVEGDNLFYTGVYTSNTSILVSGDLTLDAQNDPNATFVFQSASTVGTADNARILLINGAKASNVYWQAGSAATLQTNTTWNGNILAYDNITMNTGATSCGRLFAGAFTDGFFVFDSNKVAVPGNTALIAGCE